MPDNSANNKRIAKNTIYLYIRSILVVIISLFTSRIVLKNLGVTDFGIYNVVGGVVMMFSFLNSALTAAVQRYISFELGKGNETSLNKVFCISINVHIFLAIIVIVIGETIGLWFLYNFINVPPNRFYAALFVYQTALFSFCLTILQVPSLACVIAHEDMNIYAFATVFDVFLKLIAVVLLVFVSGDRLIWYGALILSISFLLFLFYVLYSRKKYLECKFHFLWDKKLFSEIISFSSWSLYGGLGSVASGQGVNIVINMFFGAAVNASRGIAYQVNAAVTALYSSFSQAINPQIVKQYSVQNYAYVKNLSYSGAKLIYFLVFAFALPLIVEMETIIDLWLGQKPNHVVAFCRLILIATLFGCLSMPFVQVVQATGNIRKYQLIIGSMLFADLPLSYIAILLTHLPESCFVVHIFIQITVTVVRAYMCGKLLHVGLGFFFKNVILKITPVTLIGLSCVGILLFFDSGILRLSIVIAYSIVVNIFSIFFIGLDSSERGFVIEKIRRRIHYE